MTEHLIELGHRKISFLTGPRNIRSSFDRLSGFKAALDSHNIPFMGEYVHNTEFTFDGGYTAARLLLENSELPTAIFAGNDEAAYGVIFAIHEKGLRIPDHISVCGYDDILFSKQYWPGLTTVHQPADIMIEKALYMLIELLKGGKPEQMQITLPAHLALRGSTGKPGLNIS